MVRFGDMAGSRATDVIIVHPNRSKATVQLTRAVVVVLLLATIGLLVLITVGGWNTLEGAQPIQIGYIAVYGLLCLFALRWNRGVLPLSAALGLILAIFALVAAPGWFERDHPGFAAPPLPASFLGTVTLLLIPVQALLIVFAMRGMAQGWNVEEERPAGTRYDDLDYATTNPA